MEEQTAFFGAGIMHEDFFQAAVKGDAKDLQRTFRISDQLELFRAQAARSGAHQLMRGFVRLEPVAGPQDFREVTAFRLVVQLRNGSMIPPPAFGKAKD